MTVISFLFALDESTENREAVPCIYLSINSPEAAPVLERIRRAGNVVLY